MLLFYFTVLFIVQTSTDLIDYFLGRCARNLVLLCFTFLLQRSQTTIVTVELMAYIFILNYEPNLKYIRQSNLYLELDFFFLNTIES